MASDDEGSQTQVNSSAVVYPTTSTADAPHSAEWVRSKILVSTETGRAVMLPVKIWWGKRIALWWWGLMLKYMGSP